MITNIDPSASLAALVKSSIVFPTPSAVGATAPSATGTGVGATVCIMACMSNWKEVMS